MYNGANTHTRNHIRQREKLLRFRNRKRIFTRRERFPLEMREDILGRLRVDQFLRVDFRDDGDGGVEVGVVPFVVCG